MVDSAIVLKGGYVCDPSSNQIGLLDILIINGKIASISHQIEMNEAKLLDVAGLIITPGLVDIHTHLYASAGIPQAWAGDYSIWPDGFSFRSGITTMVDAGSSGRRNFPHFRSTVIERSKTRVFAMLNITGYGMMSEMVEQFEEDFDIVESAALIKEHRDILVGSKCAHYRNSDWKSVDTAVALGELAGVPAMVDFGFFVKERPYWEMLSRLRAGDISTHCFRAPVPIINKQGKVYQFLFEAGRRGVFFDLGHGGGSFLFRNAIPAFNQGFWPDSISTDLHVLSMNGSLIDLPTCMSRAYAMGMPLEKVVLHTTHRPAQMIGHPELGTLSIGSDADISVWSLQKGNFGFKDAVGGRIEGKERFVCEMTFFCGELMWDLNARDAVPWSQIPFEAGIRSPLEVQLYPEAYGIQ